MHIKNVSALLLLFLLGITWGSGYVIAKYATTNGISPMAYAFWQSLGPAIIVTVLSCLIHRRWPLHRRYTTYYVMCGLLGIAIPNTNMYFTAAHLPASLLAVLINVAPILTYPIALLARQEKFCVSRMLGVVCGVGGIMCVLLPKMGMPESNQIVWILQALFSPVCFSCCAVYIAKYAPHDVDSLSLASGMLIVSSILLLPLVYSQHALIMLHPFQQFPDLMVVVEILLSSLGYVVMFLLLRRSGAVFYSLVAGVVVLTGIFWGGIIFHERLSFWEIIAMGLIFLGINLVSRQSHDELTKTN